MIVTMAAAWHGGVRGNNPYVKNAKLRTAIARGMAYWFSRDFRLPGCLDRGGTSVCPCSNTDKSLWCVLRPGLPDKILMISHYTGTKTGFQTYVSFSFRDVGSVF